VWLQYRFDVLPFRECDSLMAVGAWCVTGCADAVNRVTIYFKPTLQLHF
jgi:hypothetical protein